MKKEVVPVAEKEHYSSEQSADIISTMTVTCSDKYCMAGLAISLGLWFRNDFLMLGSWTKYKVR